MSDLVARAEAFARAAHSSIDQRRKYSGEPYINHPEAVAKIVASVTDDEPSLAAAWLHDVVEDTPITIGEIAAEFGDDIAGLVENLTNVARPEDGNRKQRKAINRAHSAMADPRAKTVKLADVIHNLGDLAVQDPKFARVYAEEKRLQITVLKEGDSSLMKRVRAIIDDITRDSRDKR